MNKQSNTYTTIYIIVLVLLVGTALAATSLALRDKQQANADADKMRQILAAALITPDPSQVIDQYDKHVKPIVVNANGQEIEGDAFRINVAEEVKKPADERQLPVFICTLDNGETKYILPAYGAGLWGPIWGYIALTSPIRARLPVWAPKSRSPSLPTSSRA